MPQCPACSPIATPGILTPASSVRRVAAARQAGASLIEFSIVVIPVLLAALGIIEIAQWLFTRQAVSLALLEAGRAASVRHANPGDIEAAFEQAMQALFTSDTDSHAEPIKLARALQQRELTTGQAPWRIEVLSPPAAAFHDFSQPDLQVDGAGGLAVINNNYLAEQDARYRRQGWEQGRGPRSKLTVFQANTLVLRATWLHSPVVPGVSGLLRLLGKQHGSYSQHAMAQGGYLPIKQELALVMQSHPVNWPSSTNGRVTGPEAAPISDTAAVATPACAGIWCLGRWQPGSGTSNTLPPSSSVTEPGDPGHFIDPAPTEPPAYQPDPDATTLPGGDPDDPACGISLCCGD